MGGVSAMLALHTRNKSEFITGACVRNPNNVQLQDQWDRCNVVVLSWLLGCVSYDLYKGQVFSKIDKDVWDELEETYNKQDRLMQFLMGLDDVFSSVRSLIGTTDPIHDVKSAFATLSRDESHKNSHVASKSVNARPSGFAASGTCDTSKGSASVAGWTINYGAIQHITFCDKLLFDLIDATHLNLTVAHLNGTDDQLSRVNKVIVNFYESICKIQDFTQKFSIWTGSERGEYIFEKNGINDLNFFDNVSDSSLKSCEPNDDEGDIVVDGNETTTKKTSTEKPNVSIVDGAARNKKTAEFVPNTDTSGSTSSRKDLGSGEYATKTDVLEGIHSTIINDDYESEGEDIESFGQMSESPDTTVGPSVRRLVEKQLRLLNIMIILNKIKEPSSYLEVVKDDRWIEPMNLAMEALNENKT
ncbi:hypothetical protein Tco_0500657 [Tanacetum coccineum]